MASCKASYLLPLVLIILCTMTGRSVFPLSLVSPLMEYLLAGKELHSASMIPVPRIHRKIALGVCVHGLSS